MDLSRTEIWQIKLMNKYLLKQIKKRYNNKRIKILDIGSGYGFLSGLVKKNKYDITEIDIKPQNSKVIKADVYKLPFRNNSFDVITSKSSFCYWEDSDKALYEITRVLKPNGYLFIMDIKKPKNKLIKNFLLIMDRIFLGGKNKSGAMKDFLNRAYSLEELNKVLKNKSIDYKIKICYWGLYYLIIGENKK